MIQTIPEIILFFDSSGSLQSLSSWIEFVIVYLTWFTQEPKARQKVARLRVQQTYRTLLHIGMLGVGTGRTQPIPLPTEIKKWHSPPPSITVNRDILYPFKGQIQRINKISELSEFVLTFYFWTTYLHILKWQLVWKHKHWHFSLKILKLSFEKLDFFFVVKPGFLLWKSFFFSYDFFCTKKKYQKNHKQ